MDQDRKVDVAVVATAAVGFAIGYLPWVLTDPSGSEGVHEELQSFVRGALLVGLAIFVVSTIPGFVIAASRRAVRRLGFAVLVVAMAVSTVLGIALGAISQDSDVTVSVEGLAIAIIVVLVIAGMGAGLGYGIGRAVRSKEDRAAGAEDRAVEADDRVA